MVVNAYVRNVDGARARHVAAYAIILHCGAQTFFFAAQAVVRSCVVAVFAGIIKNFFSRYFHAYVRIVACNAGKRVLVRAQRAFIRFGLVAVDKAFALL